MLSTERTGEMHERNSSSEELNSIPTGMGTGTSTSRVIGSYSEAELINMMNSPVIMHDDRLDSARYTEEYLMAHPAWAKKVFNDLDAHRQHLKNEAWDRLEGKMRFWEVNRPSNRLWSRSPTIKYVRYRQQFKQLGKEIAKYIKLGQPDALVDLLNNVRDRYILPNSYTKDYLFDSLVDKGHCDGMLDGFRTCPECNHIHHEDGSFYRADADSYICPICTESSRFIFSSEMDGYISSRDAHRFYANQRAYNNGNNDWITGDYASSNDYEWDDCCDAYTGEDLYHEDEDNYDEPEEDRMPRGMSDYHGSRRDFFVIQANPNEVYQNMPPLGLELEMYCPDRGATVNDLRAAQMDNKFIGPIILERDGSLSSDCGLEMITNPLGYSEWLKMGPAMCKRSLSTECVAYNHPDYANNYGIHITLNRDYLSALQETRLMMFMTSVENFDFMRTVAQRQGIYGAQMDMGGLSRSKQKVTYIGGIARGWTNPRKKIMGAGKYAPINFKGKLAEIRIFQSTLHVPSFMKNLEFVWAIVEWVRSDTGNTWYHGDFVKWFALRHRANHDYPNLWNYLQRPSYRVKKYAYVIGNTWRPLFTKKYNPARGTVVEIPTEANDELLAA